MTDRPDFLEDLKADLVHGSVVHRRRRRARERVVAVVAALIIVTGGLALLTERGSPDERSVVADAPESDAPTSIAARWSAAATDLPGQSMPGLFWTGDVLLVVHTENGGNDVAGERWDPTTNTVTPMADSGLVWRFNPAMVWTGEQLLMVGGSNGPGLDEIAAAYDPTADVWAQIADPPREISGPAVWTGNEMIVWQAGLAFEPRTDTWRDIAPTPLSPRDALRGVTHWTGSELVVWGGCTPRPTAQCDEANTDLLGDGASYDPVGDAWTMLPPSPLTPAVHSVSGVIDGDVVIVVTLPGEEPAGVRAAIYDPSAKHWTPIDSPPLSPRRYASAAVVADRFVAWGGLDEQLASTADGAVFDTTAGRWQLLPASPGPGRGLHEMAAAGARVYVSSTLQAGPPLILDLGTPAAPAPISCVDTGLAPGATPDDAAVASTITPPDHVEARQVRSWTQDGSEVELLVPGLHYTDLVGEDVETVDQPPGTLYLQGDVTKFLGTTGSEGPCRGFELSIRGGDQANRSALALEIAQRLEWTEALGLTDCGQSSLDDVISVFTEPNPDGEGPQVAVGIVGGPTADVAVSGAELAGIPLAVGDLQRGSGAAQDVTILDNGWCRIPVSTFAGLKANAVVAGADGSFGLIEVAGFQPAGDNGAIDQTPRYSVSIDGPTVTVDVDYWCGDCAQAMLTVAYDQRRPFSALTTGIDKPDTTELAVATDQVPPRTPGIVLVTWSASNGDGRGILAIRIAGGEATIEAGE